MKKPIPFELLVARLGERNEEDRAEVGEFVEFFLRAVASPARPWQR